MRVEIFFCLIELKTAPATELCGLKLLPLHPRPIRAANASQTDDPPGYAEPHQWGSKKKKKGNLKGTPPPTRANRRPCPPLSDHQLDRTQKKAKNAAIPEVTGLDLRWHGVPRSQPAERRRSIPRARLLREAADTAATLAYGLLDATAVPLRLSATPRRGQRHPSNRLSVGTSAGQARRRRF